MDYLITEKSDRYSSFNTFPTTMTKFDETMAGKTLKEINYDFYWIGNAMQNCKFYFVSSCLENIEGYQNNFKSIISNITNYLNSNYVSVTFLQKHHLWTQAIKYLKTLISEFQRKMRYEKRWCENF